MTNEKENLTELIESSDNYCKLREIEIEHERKMTLFDEKPSDIFKIEYGGKKIEENNLETILTVLSPENASHYTQRSEVVSFGGVGGLIRIGKAKIKICYWQRK